MHRIALISAILCAAIFVPTATGSAYAYWYQQNMPANAQGSDFNAHNHRYNELYFGPNAGWRGEVWERTPAGYRHFDKWCYGNCFFAHPAYYYDYAFCSNRDTYGQTHFVYDCMDEW